MNIILKNANIYKNGKFENNVDVELNGKNIKKIHKNSIVSDKNIILCDNKYIFPAFANCCLKTEINDKNQAKFGVGIVILLNNDFEYAKFLKQNGHIVYFGLGVFNEGNLPNLTEIESKINLLKQYDIFPIFYIKNSFYCDEGCFADLMALSKKYDVPLITASNETLDEVGECDKVNGVTPIGLLQEYGVLDNNHLILGCENCDKEDVELLRYHNSFVCVTPTDSLRSGNGIAPLYSFLKNNISVCVGGTNILKEISLLSDLQSGTLNEKSVVGFSQLVDIASSNPNRLLNRNAGEIKEGAFADLVVLDSCDLLNLTSENVFCTIVDGKIVYKR